MQRQASGWSRTFRLRAANTRLIRWTWPTDSPFRLAANDLDRAAKALSCSDGSMMLGETARGTEQRLLMALSRGTGLDSLIPGAAPPASSAAALGGYAVAVRHLLAGRQREARAALEWVRSSGQWNTLPHVAAEADLLRLKSGSSLIVRVGN
jgi:hypothetical protein